MRYEIIWLPKAEQRFDEIISWLRQNWTDREIDNFIDRVIEVLDLVRLNPRIYRYSGKGRIHQAVITRHTLLLFRIKKDKVELLTFFDTRQDPQKKFR